MNPRLSFAISKEKLKRQFSLSIKEPELRYSYNIGAGQNAYVIDNQSNELKIMRWGFLPHWAKDPQVGLNYAYAASEIISTHDTFRIAARRQRCLIFADSFYEWRKQGRQMQPYRVLLEDNGVMVFAGLWSEWQNEDGAIFRTFTVLTSPANYDLRLFGQRMPVILRSSQEQALWLSDATFSNVSELLKPLADNSLYYYPVSKELENLDFNHPEVHRQIELSAEEKEFWDNL